MTAKLKDGGGELILHSRVRPSQGSPVPVAQRLPIADGHDELRDLKPDASKYQRGATRRKSPGTEVRFIIDSWINQVERWFAESQLESSEGVQTSTKQLESDIRFIEAPSPYRWTKSADEILASGQTLLPIVERTLCGEL